MNTQLFTNGQFDVKGGQLRVPRLSQDCFKWAECLQVSGPVLMFALAVFVAMVESAVPASAQTTGPLITGNPDTPFLAIQNMVRLGTYLMVAVGICGVAWACINGMRRHSWGAQLLFGLACLGFSGIVALLSNLANTQ